MQEAYGASIIASQCAIPDRQAKNSAAEPNIPPVTRLKAKPTRFAVNEGNILINIGAMHLEHHEHGLHSA